MLESILHLTSECFFDFHHFTDRPRKQRVNEKWIWRLFESAKRCFCVLLRFTGAEAFVKSRAVTHGHILTSQKNLLYLLETFCFFYKEQEEGQWRWAFFLSLWTLDLLFRPFDETLQRKSNGHMIQNSVFEPPG